MLPGHASVFQLPPQHLDILRCHRPFLKRVASITQHQHILCKKAVRGHYHVVRSVNEVGGSVKLCLILALRDRILSTREGEFQQPRRQASKKGDLPSAGMKGYSSSTRLELIRFVRKSSEGGELVTHLQNGGRGHVVVILAQVFQQVFHFSCGHGGTGNELQGLDEGLASESSWLRRASSPKSETASFK